MGAASRRFASLPAPEQDHYAELAAQERVRRQGDVQSEAIASVLLDKQLSQSREGGALWGGEEKGIPNTMDAARFDRDELLLAASMWHDLDVEGFIHDGDSSVAEVQAPPVATLISIFPREAGSLFTDFHIESLQEVTSGRYAKTVHKNILVGTQKSFVDGTQKCVRSVHKFVF